MSEPRYRKLAALGIASLVGAARPEVLERLPGEIMNLWTDVFGELKEAKRQADAAAAGAAAPLRVFWEQDQPPHSYLEESMGTTEEQRKRMLFANDPVRTVGLVGFVREKLQAAEMQVGADQFKALYLDKADGLLLQDLQRQLMEL